MSTQEQQQATVPSAETQQGESHPFSRSWTVWHDPPISKKQKTKHWENRLNKVGSFQTIEEFWGIFNGMKDASDIPGSIQVFRSDVRPTWEDPENENGGTWIFQICQQAHGRQRRGGPQGRDYSELWLKAVLACVGDMYGDHNVDICGCTSTNKSNATAHILRISLWIKTASDSAVRAIGNKFRELLNLGGSDVVKFYVNRETAVNGIYKTNPKLTL